MKDATNSNGLMCQMGAGMPFQCALQLRTCRLLSHCRKGQRPFLYLLFRNASEAKTEAFLAECRDESFLDINLKWPVLSLSWSGFILCLSPPAPQ